MDLLAELIFVLNQHQVGISENVLPDNSKLKKLYSLISLGKVRTDEQASEAIYKCSPKDKKYLMLKRNLISRLADLMLEAEPNEAYRDNYSHIQFLFEQKLAVTEKLLQQNVYHNAEKIIGKVEKKAESYHLIIVQLKCARQLRMIHALKGFPAQTEAYDRAVGILSKHFIYESKAQGFSQIIQSKVKFFISHNPDLMSQAREFSRQISEWIREFPSPFLQLYGNRIQIALQHQTHNVKDWRLSIEALSELPNQFPFLKSSSLDLEISLDWVRFHRATGDLEEMERCLEGCLKLSDYQAFNKFEVMALSYDLAMKKNDWEKALEIVKEVFRTGQFQHLDSIDISAWGIRALYLNYVFLKLQQPKKQFAKFADRNQVFEFLTTRQPVSKDKKGYNLHLVILRLIFQKYYSTEGISSDGNKMLVYFQRHLKLLESERTGIFFKSLAKVASANFDEQYVEKREAYFFERISEAKYELFLFDDCEILPYEKLWELVNVKAE